MIQIRDVPDEVHRMLRGRAAHAGMSLSDYLRREVTSIARRPTMEDLVARIRARGASTVGESSAVAVRAERAARK